MNNNGKIAGAEIRSGSVEVLRKALEKLFPEQFPLIADSAKYDGGNMKVNLTRVLATSYFVFPL